MWSRRRVRNAPTASSRPAQIRLTSDLEIAGAAQGDDQFVHAAGRHPVDVGLHHHRVQGLVDPPPRRQDAGEERPGAQLGNAKAMSPA